MKMPKALALAVSGGMLLLPLAPPAGDLSGANASIEERLPSVPLPFSLNQVLDHFNEAFGKHALRLDERTFVYVDRDNPDETVVLTVVARDPYLDVTLLTTGDYGLNYLREFFEAPFFLRSETEQFYAFLDRGLGTRSITLDRFTFRLSLLQTGDWLAVTLEFGPAQIYQPGLASVHANGWQPGEQPGRKSAGPRATLWLPFFNLQTNLIL